MLLIFFRHGAALDRQEATLKGIDEADRPLTKEGREKTRRMAELLVKLDLVPDEIIASPYLRAVDTAEIIKKTLDLDEKISLTEQLLPEKKIGDLLSFLKSHKALGDKTLFVGHEPNLSHLISSILGGKKTFIDLKKSGIAVVEVESKQDAAAGTGVLKTLIGPKIV